MKKFSSMQRFACLLTGAALASVVSVPPAAAYDDEERIAELEATTVRKGPRRIIVELGGGAQYIDLPNMKWTALTDINGEIDKRQNNGEINDYGGAASGSLYVPLGDVSTLLLSGFYSQADNTKRKHCESTDDLFCTVYNIENIPGQSQWTLPGFTTRNSREVDYWGASSEVTFGRDPRPMYRSEGGHLLDFWHWGVGFNVRGIDQENRTRLHYDDNPDNSIRLNETLETTYYGGYVSGTWEFSVLNFFGIASNWRSFATFRGGVYGTDTDYHGRFTMEDVLNLQETRLRLSDDEIAFIGGASFETRIPICRRTTLSLLTDYEYFSYVPQVRYFNGQDVTRLGDDDMLAVRTQIRFNIGFGPDGLYEQDSLK